MFIDETNQETQPEQEIEQVEAETEEESDSSDPFDTMSEAEIRAEAKKLRAIKTRHTKSEEKPADEGYLKRSDIERENENKAKAVLQKSDDPVAKAILEHWTDLAPVYGKVASRGKLSDESIIEDLKDALVVWQRRQPAPKEDTKEAEAEVAHIAGTGGSAPKDSTPKKERLIKPQASMSDWYKNEKTN